MSECRIVKASQREDFLQALSFVLPHEKTSCALTRKILDREEGIYLIVRAPRHGGGFGLVDGVFFFCEGDILLPCLSGSRACAIKALAGFLEGKRLFCVSALEADLAKFRSALALLARPPRLRERRDYRFLVHEDRQAARAALAALPEDCKIQVAAPCDEEALLPLHLAYMREEVLLCGGALNGAFERLQLREALKSQVVVAAVRDRGGSQPDMLAKAGTNAIAAHVMQLGGVYTQEAERGRGLAASLTAFLAESAAQKGMATVLFAGRENSSALAAYRNAGFCDSGKAYTIEYYGM